MDYLIGIDAGGTKTRAKAYDLTGKCLLEVVGDAGNIVLQFENTISVLQKLLDNINSSIEGTCQVLLMGISGIETSGKIEIIRNFFNRYAEKIIVVNDAELGLLNKLKGEDGILVIAGTGSVAYQKKNNQRIRQGGWGHLLGDEGSAYWIGIQCYKKLTKDYDQSIEHILSPFSKAFLSYLDIEEPLEAIRSIYDKNKKEIAKIAQFVAEQSENYDEAKEILIQAGEKLADLAQKLIIKTDSNHNTPLAVTGSVLEKNPIVYTIFLERMKSFTTNIVLNNEENTKAVWYLYTKEV